jgi:two-component system heavy metal sensor histidine kinase CusS
MIRLSIAQRLALMFALISLLTLGTIGVLLYSSLERELAWRDDQTLEGRLERMENLLVNAGTVSELRTQPQLYANMLGNTDNVLWVLNENREVLIEINPPNLPIPPVATGSSIEFTNGATPVDYRLAGYRADIGGQSLTLIAGKTLTERNRMLAGYRSTLWWALIIGAVISGSVGWLVSRWGLGPVRQLSKNVESIRTNNLDTRLQPLDQYPELSQLTSRLNEMIARLEAGFTQLARFSEDLAHEMRTPLNNLLGQTQQCLSKPRESADYAALLLSNLEEYERLSRMINSMLFLARAEKNGTETGFETVSIHSLVERLFDYFSDIAEDNRISLINKTEGTLNASPDLLQRALANLVDNALNHTADNGTIIVSTHHDKGVSQITVFNSGEHISEKHLDRVFDRFYRCDPARQNASQTGGLGLAIVESIMKGHGGHSEIRNVPSGVEVTMTFPRLHQG